MTRARTTALAASLGLATACWFVVGGRMSGMDMGVETDLGSFPFFAALWVPMMAAMMLPSARAGGPEAGPGGRGPAQPLLFAASYLAVWAAVGLAVYALYRPHGTRRRRRADGRGGALPAHAARARMPPALPRERALRAALRRPTASGRASG